MGENSNITLALHEHIFDALASAPIGGYGFRNFQGLPNVFIIIEQAYRLSSRYGRTPRGILVDPAFFTLQGLLSGPI